MVSMIMLWFMIKKYKVLKSSPNFAIFPKNTDVINYFGQNCFGTFLGSYYDWLDFACVLAS